MYTKMNHSQARMLKGLGVFLFLLAGIFIAYSYQSAQDIRMADGICNAQVDVVGYKVEIGQFAQRVLDYEGDCNKIHLLRLGVDYSWIVFALGIIMFFVGIWGGLGDKGKKSLKN